MKEVNKQQVYSCSEFSMYNVHQYIMKLEDLKDFDYPFARLNNVESQFDDPKEDEEKK